MFYEALAMIRALGVSTFFINLSAADMRWPEVIQSIAAQHGVKYTPDEIKNLRGGERSKWLRTNPVTAAQMFQYRVETFLATFLMIKAAPIGTVMDFILRIEFQAHGSTHVHTMFWIKNAPKIGVVSDKEITTFIDKHISCSLPDDNNDELHTLVSVSQTTIQIYSHHRHSQWQCSTSTGDVTAHYVEGSGNHK